MRVRVKIPRFGVPPDTVSPALASVAETVMLDKGLASMLVR